MGKEELLLAEKLKKFNKVVIWGLRNRYHTHRYIHLGFYETLRKIGAKVVWVEDENRNRDIVGVGDLVISSEVQGKFIPEKRGISDYSLPIIKGASYCLHNFKDIFTRMIDDRSIVKLQVYSNKAEGAGEKWNSVTCFDRESRTLYQPWGTNLLPSEFKRPIFSNSRFVFWVGSIWNNSLNQGNVEQIGQLRNVLRETGLSFVPVRFVPDSINTFLVRHSRIAPAIAGSYQVKVDYLPCRMFKNISYGQLGISNVKKFEDVFAGCSIKGNNIEELVHNSLALSKRDYLSIIGEQQDIARKHTYIQSLSNIIEAFK